MTLNQRKSTQKSNDQLKMPPKAKDHTLQQYADTDGHFSLVRNFRLADLVTIMNGVCGSLSIFSSAHYLLSNDPDYLWTALSLPLAGLMFDFLDGKVARWRKSTSLLGQELDSLADLISFGVAPALLAFVVGLRTYLDTVCLTGFICCGLARLARFNATVALVPKNEAGKASYFEGLPIPTSLGLVAVLSYWVKNDWIEGKQGIPWGTITLWGEAGGRGELHLVSIVFGLWAAAMRQTDVNIRRFQIGRRVSSVASLFTAMVSAGDVQRLFLQAVLSRGALSVTLAQAIWAKCVDAVNDADNSLHIPHSNQRDAWDGFVARVNTSIDALDLEFRHLHDQHTGREMYALVNRKGDEIAQMASHYSPAEIAFFRALVEQIMLAPNESYCVSSLAALREVHDLQTSMSKSQAEIVLGSFVANGWLYKSKQGRYSLSTRSLLELLPYLKTTYPEEVNECTICMDIITHGVACHTANCKTRMHFHCFATYRRLHNACASCGKDWPQQATELLPVGEGAAKSTDDARRRTRQKEADSDEEDEEEFDAESQPTQSQSTQGTQSQPSRSQRSRNKGKKKQVQEDVDMDEDEEEEPEVKKEAPKRSQARRRSRR
ncbi:CDP-diacylglycerol-serine O-phosphatidyltransferase [Pleurotus pulmonarius]|nr:CDP-diacylglycerol-serine O-phosphatidyltransferase [Pleurotus pulmonarius]